LWGDIKRGVYLRETVEEGVDAEERPKKEERKTVWGGRGVKRKNPSTRLNHQGYFAAPWTLFPSRRKIRERDIGNAAKGQEGNRQGSISLR